MELASNTTNGALSFSFRATTGGTSSSSCLRRASRSETRSKFTATDHTYFKHFATNKQIIKFYDGIMTTNSLRFLTLYSNRKVYN